MYASFCWWLLLLSPVIGCQSSEVMFPRHLLRRSARDEIIPSCTASTYWLEQVFAHAPFLMTLQCVRGGVTLSRCGCSKNLRHRCRYCREPQGYWLHQRMYNLRGWNFLKQTNRIRLLTLVVVFEGDIGAFMQLRLQNPKRRGGHVQFPVPGKFHLSANVIFPLFPPFSQLLTGTLDGKLRLFEPSSGALLSRDACTSVHWVPLWLQHFS